MRIFGDTFIHPLLASPGPFWRRENILISFLISGLNGNTVPLFTLLWPNGGNMARAK